MRKNTWWNRVLLCGVLAVATLATTEGTASAATQCFSQSYSDGANIVPGTGGGNVTRAITRQRAGNTWDDWVWRGTEFQCPRGRTCEYAWEKSKTTTTGWAIGGGTDLGNASSPSKKWYNTVVSFVGGYQKTTQLTTAFTWTVHLNGGDVAQPVQVAVRRWTQGDFAGGWVRTNRGCQGGTTYEWNGNVRFGDWTRNVFEKEKVGYAVNGRM
ncbi:hypothetical protein [Streptomyces sp. NBC_01451]|uniref:hypothetical protein n=1 Tax=Streptomyces sp. NBC_01451 TaxID=2903872 RepID=UPI002E373F4B|nr:hypothetical protein [Streptomyces sp. NBC_01451]